MKRVVLIQRILPHYRISFVDGLAARLASEAVELHLIYGQERPGEVPVSVPAPAPWARRIRNRYFSVGPATLVWQPCASLLCDADLLIVEQANSLLLNHALQARLLGRGVPIAYWGHGRNRQAAGWRVAGEKIKVRLSNRVDWWFAYTDGCRGDLLDSGYPAERITVVNNAVDTGGMVRGLDDSSSENVQGNTCIYCGGMYPAKRLDFLLEAAVRIRQHVPDFELILIGSGPTEHLAAAAAERYSWIQYLGPLTGVARTEWFGRCRAQLMPGLVGLTIVDSFAAATPLITTDIPIHSPEIDYLVPGFNGLMSTNSIEAYAHTVVAFLRSAEMQRQLVAGCRVSAATYTIQTMIERFAAGVLQSLTAGVRR